METNPRETPCWSLPTGTGASALVGLANWREAQTQRPDGTGTVHRAGRFTGTAADLWRYLQRTQSWFPTRQHEALTPIPCSEERPDSTDHMSNRRTEHNTGGPEASSYLPIWRSYIRLAEALGVFRKLDKRIRHRLQVIQVKHWKRGRTVLCVLRARGMSPSTLVKAATDIRRWWKNSVMGFHIPLLNLYFDELGVPYPAS